MIHKGNNNSNNNIRQTFQSLFKDMSRILLQTKSQGNHSCCPGRLASNCSVLE